MFFRASALAWLPLLTEAVGESWCEIDGAPGYGFVEIQIAQEHHAEIFIGSAAEAAEEMIVG